MSSGERHGGNQLSACVSNNKLKTDISVRFTVAVKRLHPSVQLRKRHRYDDSAALLNCETEIN